MNRIRFVFLLGAALTLVVGATTGGCILDNLGTSPYDPAAGGGNAGECVLATDCPGIDEACHFRHCEAGTCTMHDAQAGNSCQDSGGQVCDGLGSCVECINPSQCGPNEICKEFQCADAHCVDGVPNEGETGLDCGGTCPPCPNGQGCLDAFDCISGYCGPGDICAPCTTDPECTEGKPGTFCNAEGVCEPKKLQGAVCQEKRECQSDFCIDEVCCDAECLGVCESCREASTGADNGTCAPIPVDTDPDGECIDDGNPCGANDTGCAVGACNLFSSGTPCSAATCNGNDYHPPDTCDGAGTCDPSTPEPCNEYVCVAAIGCPGGCSVPGDCMPTYYCDSGLACSSKVANGQSCPDGPAQCNSGNCVEGVCCNNGCGGNCRSCLAANTGGTQGICSDVNPGIDPLGGCGSSVCDGLGDCMVCTQDPSPIGNCPGGCNWCTGDTCVFDCDVQDECQGGITCPDGWDCQVDCTGDNACDGATIDCPESHACDVTCGDGAAVGSDDQHCRDMTINCPITGTCTLHCNDDDNACQNLAQNCGYNECTATCDAGTQPTTYANSSCSCSGCGACQ